MSNLEQMGRDLFPAQHPAPPLSGLAIASLALGVLTVGPVLLAVLLPSGGALTALLYLVIVGAPALLAIVFGHIASAAARRGERRGRGMARWGLSLGYFAIFGPLVLSAIVGLLAKG